jgi:GTP cyclohydrolase II
MNLMFTHAGEPGAVGAVADAGDFRAVHRALSDLRRGTAVLLETGTATLVALAAETLSAASLAEFEAVAGGPALLVLDAGRAAHWAGGAPRDEAVVAFPVAASMLRPEVLLGMADPTAPQVLSPPPAAVVPPDGAEAALALAKLARLLPAMLVAPLAPTEISGHNDLLRVAAAGVLALQAAGESGLTRVSEARVPLEDAAECRVVAFRDQAAGPEHLAVLVGAPERVAATAAAPLARIHSECFTGDLLGSLRCDCGPQLRGAIRRMAAEGAGVLLYLAQEGRGIGLANKLRAYALQDRGLDTLDANRALGWGTDERSFAAAAAMLRALGIARVRLLTNNPKKLAALADGGIRVERVSHLFAANGVNDAYLATKTDRFGHLAD